MCLPLMSVKVPYLVYPQIYVECYRDKDMHTDTMWAEKHDAHLETKWAKESKKVCLSRPITCRSERSRHKDECESSVSWNMKSTIILPRHKDECASEQC